MPPAQKQHNRTDGCYHAGGAKVPKSGRADHVKKIKHNATNQENQTPIIRLGLKIQDPVFLLIDEV